MNGKLIRKGIGAVVSTLACSLLSAIVYNQPTQAAERISIRVRGAQRAVNVADLEFFVTTGEIPRSLKWYADQMTDEEISGLREVLQKQFEVEPRVVSTFVNDSIGENLLRRLNSLFWGGTTESNFKALRSSLVLAAYDRAEGLTILNAIRKYPLRDLRINLNPVLQAASDLDDILIHSRKIFAYIQQKAGRGVTSEEVFLARLPDPRLPGDVEWSKSTIRITNPARDPGEQVAVDLYLPDNLEEPTPLVVISHGMASTRKTFAYLAKHLASQGFAVATMEHPATDASRFNNYIAGFQGEPQIESAIQRPLDITALLDYLEQQAESNPDWAKVQTDRVGVMGQSLGGYTSLAVGGAQFDFDYLDRVCGDSEKTILPFNLSLLLQCRGLELPDETYNTHDDRIAAILALNPVGSGMFGPTGLGQIDVPVMLVAGSNDFFAPAVKEQIEPFTWLEAEERFLVLVENGTHFSFLPGDSGGEGVFNLPQELIGPDPELAHPGMKALATIFLQTYIVESEEYAPYLTEFLLPSPEGGDFNFALTRSLTEAEIEEAVQSGQ